MPRETRLSRPMPDSRVTHERVVASVCCRLTRSVGVGSTAMLAQSSLRNHESLRGVSVVMSYRTHPG